MQGTAGSGVFELVALVKEPLETATNVQCLPLEKDYSEGVPSSCNTV